MSTISFYRQMRQDQGVRTGIEVDGNGEFTKLDLVNEEDQDPALLWIVDIICSGDQLPSAPDTAREWLLNSAPDIQRCLTAAAERIPVGIDADIWPFRFQAQDHPFSVTIRCSAVRRIEARQIADILRDIQIHWRDYIERLVSEESLTHW